MLLFSDKNEILNRILKSYEVYYDIEKCDEKYAPLVAKAEFHVHNEKYILVKQAKMWEADSNEYVYIFNIDNLSAEIFNKCKNYAYENGMSKINPKPGHMSSYITTIFICNSCDKEAQKLIKKCNLYKSFKLSLHGWMDFNTACIDISTDTIFGNKSARPTIKFLKELFIKNTSFFKKDKKITRI